MDSWGEGRKGVYLSFLFVDISTISIKTFTSNGMCYDILFPEPLTNM